MRFSTFLQYKPLELAQSHAIYFNLPIAWQNFFLYGDIIDLWFYEQ